MENLQQNLVTEFNNILHHTPWSNRIYSRNVRVVQHCKSVSVICHINKKGKKNQMIISIDTKEALKRLFYDISLNKLCMEEVYQYNKDHIWQPHSQHDIK